MDFGREKGVFPLVLIQVKGAAKRTVFGLKNKREKAFLPFKTQLFHIQVVRYAASERGFLLPFIHIRRISLGKRIQPHEREQSVQHQQFVSETITIGRNGPGV